MVLYEVQLYMEAERYDEALDHMEKFRSFISDDLAYVEIKGMNTIKLYYLFTVAMLDSSQHSIN